MRKSLFKKGFLIAAVCPLLAAPPLTAAAPLVVPAALSQINELVITLNTVPEAELTEKSGTAVLTIQSLRSDDGPDYAKLKALLSRASVRQSLHPGTKGVLAELISPRWDAFSLAGNLWLAALRSPNTEISGEARQRLPNFIQRAHIPVLIDLLKVPGPNVLAFEVLQDVTGQKLDPNPKKWLSWWKRSGKKADIVGHMLNRSRAQLRQTQIQPVDAAAFWYAPDEISRTDKPSYAERSTNDKNAIGRWSDAARSGIKRYLEQWDSTKPLFERIVHQPDAHVSGYLRTLISDPGMGDYVCVVLAWRGDTTALKRIQKAAQQTPSVGRLLAMGTLGDQSALPSLLKMVETHKAPLSYGLMDEELRGYAAKLPALGIISAEQAFELLAHERFGMVSAVSAHEKKKGLKKAKRWLKDNAGKLTLDRKRGYYSVTAPEK